jgi:hypothetical protein
MRGTRSFLKFTMLLKINCLIFSKMRAAIFMDCGIHAREWVSTAFCLYAIDRLLLPASKTQKCFNQSLLKINHLFLDKDVTDRFDFYIMPVANPGCYVYPWNSNRYQISKPGLQNLSNIQNFFRMWRKNRRP